jgi:hypothetical protein
MDSAYYSTHVKLRMHKCMHVPTTYICYIAKALALYNARYGTCATLHMCMRVHVHALYRISCYDMIKVEAIGARQRAVPRGGTGTLLQSSNNVAKSLFSTYTSIVTMNTKRTRCKSIASQ